MPNYGLQDLAASSPNLGNAMQNIALGIAQQRYLQEQARRQYQMQQHRLLIADRQQRAQEKLNAKRGALYDAQAAFQTQRAADLEKRGQARESFSRATGDLAAMDELDYSIFGPDAEIDQIQSQAAMLGDKLSDQTVNVGSGETAFNPFTKSRMAGGFTVGANQQRYGATEGAETPKMIGAGPVVEKIDSTPAWLQKEASDMMKMATDTDGMVKPGWENVYKKAKEQWEGANALMSGKWAPKPAVPAPVGLPAASQSSSQAVPPSYYMQPDPSAQFQVQPQMLEPEREGIEEMTDEGEVPAPDLPDFPLDTTLRREPEFLSSDAQPQMRPGFLSSDIPPRPPAFKVMNQADVLRKADEGAAFNVKRMTGQDKSVQFKVPKQTKEATDQVYEPQTEEDFAKIPSGAKFRNPADGRVLTKK